MKFDVVSAGNLYMATDRILRPPILSLVHTQRTAIALIVNH